MDIVLGGPGRNRIHGGPGFDWIQDGKGADEVFAGPGGDTVGNFDLQSPGNDRVFLDRDEDEVFDGRGNYVYRGQGGGDVFTFSGGGFDCFFGRVGTDKIQGSDQAGIRTDQAGIRINLTTGKGPPPTHARHAPCHRRLDRGRRRGRWQ